MRLVGVIPAAGLGTRLGSAYPKELLPIAYHSTPDPTVVIPRPVIHCSLEQMRVAGASECVVVISEHKLEVARVLGNGEDQGVALAYVTQTIPRGLADAVDAAHPWLKGHWSCLALPDTLVSPTDALLTMWRECESSRADLVLGIFPTNRPLELGPTRIDAYGNVVEVLDKPASTDLRNTWGLAIWSPGFTEMIREAVQTGRRADSSPNLGSLFNTAVQVGLRVRAISFDEGMFHDLGTPQGLATTLRASLRHGS